MMKHLLFFSLLLTLLLLPATPLRAAEAGVEFKIDYRNGIYTVTMRPTVTPQTPGLTLAAQVTIKVLHGVGQQRFSVSNVQSLVADTHWAPRSRVDAPVEDRSADYISFELGFPTSNFATIHWQAGQAVQLFRFSNANACLGPVALLENDDPFMPPNQAGTNPGNQIDILGLPAGNRYLGVYDRKQADCRNPDGIQRTAVTLAARTVMRNGPQVAVGWRTATESNVLGFKLWRQDAETVTPLNATLIVAQESGTTSGAAYTFVDAPASPDAYALYLLDVVDLDGQMERVILGSINGQPLFLPFISAQAHRQRGQTGDMSDDTDNDENGRWQVADGSPFTIHHSLFIEQDNPSIPAVTIERILL